MTLVHVFEQSLGAQMYGYTHDSNPLGLNVLQDILK